MTNDSTSVPQTRTGQCASTKPTLQAKTATAWLAPAAMLSLLAAPAFGQTTTADILGTVSDATGAIIPNAKVTLEDNGTHRIQTAQANSSGEFDFTLLQPGRYTVTVSAPGFSDFRVTAINVNGGDHARADAKLTVGQAAQVVEVTSTTPLLQADSVNVTTTITTEAVESLPTAQRNLTSLVILTPGANEAATVDGLSSGARPDDRRLSSAYSINGEDSQLNNNQIDGTDNNERIIGTIGVKPLIDAIEEVTVQTNDYTPETGRSAGGVISVLTKRGTNSFHGGAYEFIQNDRFDAKNPFAAPGRAPELRQNDFGGSLGGPIFKDKTFFFGAAEGFRLVSGAQTPAISTVPTLAQEQNPAAIVAADPYTAGLPIDPVALNLFKLYPAPNQGGANAVNNNFIFQPKSTNFSYTIDGRIDHQFNSNNQLTARYTSNHVNAVIPTALPNVVINGVSINPGNGQYGFAGPAQDLAYNGQITYTHTFTQSLLLELRAAYTRIDNQSGSPNSGTNAATAVGFPGNIDYSAASSGLPLIGIANFAPLGDSNFVPIHDLTNTYQYSGVVSYARGRHNLRFGAESIRRQAQNQQSSNGVGNINFGLPQDAGSLNNSLATFLVGAFTGEGRNIDLYTPNYRTWEPGFFAQDTWRVNPNLTVVYGARYDFYTPFTEADGRISNYDPLNHVLLVPQKGYAFLQSQGANLSGVVASTPTAGIQTTYTNLAPRVGYAATVHPGLVARGGFGLAFFPGNYTSNASLKNAPFNAVYSPSVNGTGCQSPLANQIIAKYLAANPTAASTITNNPACQASLGQTTTLSGATGGIPIPAPQALNSPNLSLGDNVAQNFRSSYVIQFNQLIEKEFGGKNVVTIGYVGQLGRHLPATINDINVPDPNTAVLGTKLTVRPTATILPGLGEVGEYYSIGSSSYHALQVSFQRRLSQGLTVTSNYTWSHAVDDVTDLSLEGQEGWGNLDPFNIAKYETGSSDLDLRNRFVFAGNYELPFFKQDKGLKRLVLGGFQANAIWIWNAGSPFSITDNYTGQGNSIYGGIGGGPTRPLQVGNPKANGHQINQWFNPLAFETPANGQFGNTSRNSLTGPTFEHFDFSLFKNILITEKYNLELRAETFNLTNTAGYFVPNNQNDHATTNAVGTPNANGVLTPGTGFAQIVSTNPSYTPRTLQLAAKFRF